jgi:hypothetical protein
MKAYRRLLSMLSLFRLVSCCQLAFPSWFLGKLLQSFSNSLTSDGFSGRILVLTSGIWDLTAGPEPAPYFEDNDC